MGKYKTVFKTLQKSYSYVDKILVLQNDGKIEYCTDNWNVEEDIDNLISNWVSGNAQFVMVDGVKYSILQMEPERFVGTNRHKQGHLIGATTEGRDKYLVVHINNKAKGWMHKAYPTVARAAVALKDPGKLKHLDPRKRGSTGRNHSKKKKKILKKIKKAEKKFNKKLRKDKKKKAIKYAEKIVEMANSIDKQEIANKYRDEIDVILGKKEKGPAKKAEKKAVHKLLHALNGNGKEEKEQTSASSTDSNISKENPIIRREVENFLLWIENQNGLSSYVKYYLDQQDFRVISDLSKVYQNIRAILGA